MKLIRRLLLLLLCLSLTACAQTRKLTYDEAVELFASGDYAGAAAAFERLGDTANAPTYAAYSRGLVLYDQGQYAAAMPYFEKSQHFMYGQERYVYCQAHGLMEAGDFAGAALLFRSLFDFEDAPQWAEYASARAAENNKDYEAALYGYEAAGQLADAEDRLYNLRGQIYNRAIDLRAQGNYSEASILFTMLGDYLSAPQQATECKDIWLDEQYELADAYLAQGDVQSAFELFSALSGYRDAAERAEELAPQLGIELKTYD